MRPLPTAPLLVSRKVAASSLAILAVTALAGCDSGKDAEGVFNGTTDPDWTGQAPGTFNAPTGDTGTGSVPGTPAGGSGALPGTSPGTYESGDTGAGTGDTGLPGSSTGTEPPDTGAP